MPKPVVIEPLPFHSGTQSKVSNRHPMRWIGMLLTTLLLLALGFFTFAIFTFKSVAVITEPQTENIKITGSLWMFKTGDKWWLRNGNYTVKAMKSGYQPAELDVIIQSDSDSTIKIALEKLPGTLLIRTTPPQATVTVVGQSTYNPSTGITLPAGEYQIDVFADRFQPATTNLINEGLGLTNEVHVTLLPAWANVQVASTPRSTVSINGLSSNTTPCKIELLDGRHSLQFKAEGFKTFQTQVVAVANQPMELPIIHLEPADGRLRINSDPAGAQVTIDGIFVGQTPVVRDVQPDIEHVVTAFKPGHTPQTKSAIISSGKEGAISFQLKPQEGEIRFTINPPDAELIVNGSSYGKVPRSISLVAVEHTIEITHPDFKPITRTLKPRPNFPQEIKADLIPKQMVQLPKPGEPKPATKNGYVFSLIQPGPFQMGSSRREQGRRSNETLRNIELQRPFFMGIHEVSNAQFRAFRPEHDSGSIQTISLNRDEQPVVNITWEDAARYCNWLSKRDGLTPAYREVADKIITKLDPGEGYRLPTEAEWEYCARVNPPNRDLLKYPWGDGFPPKAKVGNFGDQSASDFVINPIPNYADGYPGPAPVGSFTANQFNLFDMNGNVSEWCHDVYKIHPYEPTKAYVDPIGSEDAGELWVIRGASYKSSTITNLRYCYRNYSKEKKSDVGFRICRYVE